MRTERYEAQILAEMDWWLALLQEEGMDHLRHSATLIGRQGIRDFVRENAVLLRDVPGSTVRARQALLRTVSDRSTLHGFLLACLWQVHCAHHWHVQARAYAEELQGLRPDRHAVQAAARGNREFLATLPPFWPFRDGTDPFSEGLPTDDECDEA
jgi:hypothetical protein